MFPRAALAPATVPEGRVVMTTLGSALPRAEKGSGKEQLGIVQKQEATLWGRSGHWSDVLLDILWSDSGWRGVGG